MPDGALRSMLHQPDIHRSAYLRQTTEQVGIQYLSEYPFRTGYNQDHNFTTDFNCYLHRRIVDNYILTMPDYFKLPLRLDLILQGPENQRKATAARELTCSLEESIYNNVYLIITTQYREARYDPRFGSAIWDEEFHTGNDQIYILWTDRIEASIHEGIRRFEKRLERVKVEVYLNREGTSDAHKRLIIKVSSEIRKSNHRPFNFQQTIAIAPYNAKKRQDV